MKKVYIHGDMPKVGQRYYLVEYSGAGEGTVFRLHSNCPVTEPGGQEQSSGFLGSYNDRARIAHGQIILKKLNLIDREFNKWFILYESAS